MSTIQTKILKPKLGLLERISIREVVRRLRDKSIRTRTGKKVWCPIIKHVDREKTKFEINEEEAKIVKQMFMWVGQERISIRECKC